MKPYVVTTGVLFGVLALVHLWRMILEPHLATEPWYILITIAAAAMAFWAGHVLWGSRRA